MKKFLLTLLTFLFSLQALMAQVPPPPDYHENTGPGVPDDGPLPVDQYVFILIGFALTIGVYFIYKNKKAFN